MNKPTSRRRLGRRDLRKLEKAGLRADEVSCRGAGAGVGEGNDAGRGGSGFGEDEDLRWAVGRLREGVNGLRGSRLGGGGIFGLAVLVFGFVLGVGGGGFGAGSGHFRVDFWELFLVEG